MSNTKISQMPAAALPLTGDEEVPIVQSGTSRRCTVADIQGGSVVVLGGETSYTAVAGNNDNVPLGNFNRILIDTPDGAATLRSLAAGTDGQMCVVTNRGPNNLTLNQGSGTVPDTNNLYGPANIVLTQRGSKLLQYSGILARWVMV